MYSMVMALNIFVYLKFAQRAEFKHSHKEDNNEVMDVVIISQCIHILNHTVYLKYTILLVNYTCFKKIT